MLNFLSSMIWAFIVLVGMLLVSGISVSLLPNDNPLRELLVALSRKLALTLGLAVAAVPTEFIPVVDVLYDIAAPLFLLFSWGGFIKDAIALDSPLRKKRPVNQRQEIVPEEIPAPAGQLRRIRAPKQTAEEVDSVF
ncbi:MAG: hypothetical protein JSR59_21500 [Proteobacteria bacterium]|nr:hypothetical protein [Pseudomonadota bacterium]